MAFLSFLRESVSPANIPDGLKLGWVGDPDSLNEANQQIVIKSGDGATIYVFGYTDNRTSLAFVKYEGDRPGTPIEKSGTRYPWALGMDPDGQTVTVSGQSNALVTATFSELGIW